MARSLILAFVLTVLGLGAGPLAPVQAASPYVMQIDMHGPQVVPPVDSIGWGFVRFFFSQDRFAADYTVDVKGFSGSIVLGADIRRGPPGTNGAVIYHLADGGFITMGNHITFTQAELDDMGTGLWYVTVYTALHPNGEMRGQVELPSDFRPAPVLAVVPQLPAAVQLLAPGPLPADGFAAPTALAAEPLPSDAFVAPPAALPAGAEAPAMTEALPPAPLLQVPAAETAPAARPVVISPPNTGDGGLSGLDTNPIAAPAVGLSSLIFGVGLMVLSRRV